MKRKKAVSSITFSYVGTEAHFETFLKIIVRDYLSADDPAMNSETDFVQKVESEVA